jgi:hypothetical protein
MPSPRGTPTTFSNAWDNTDRQTERIVAKSMLERFFHADTMDGLFRPPDLDSVTCYHEELDPAKGDGCRLVSTQAFDLLTTYFPGLRRMEPCKQCVQDEWERLKSSSNHADLVSGSRLYHARLRACVVLLHGLCRKPK